MPSSVLQHAPPPFYAVYLLRSVATPDSARTYIGSSPDPARRKRQHNGELTAGAHKTRNGRPWETQLVVWGFGSKIAALQFEWAWQKPHLSRHLRTKPNAAGSSSSTLDVPQPLFPLSAQTTTALMANGKRHLGAGSPQARLLVLRALLRSEPFAAWGLRLTFFEEWAWGAWSRLPPPAPDLSRGERAMPPAELLPCTTDFTGVDGARTPLLALDADARSRLKLEPPKTKGKGKEDDGTATLAGHWPEALPRRATAKGMGLTWAAIEAAPCAAPPVPPPDVDEQGDAVMSSPTKGRAAAPSHGPHDRPRFRSDDNDFARLADARLRSVLRQRHISYERFLAGSATPAPAESGPRAACAACGETVQLWDHTSYALCPAPFTELAPRAPPPRSLFGAERPSTAAVEPSRHCDAVYHLECLSDHFLASAGSAGTDASRTFLLPTHGTCPSCAAGPGLWSDVVRATFRRRDVADAELAARAKHAAKAARLAAKAPKTTTRRKQATPVAMEESSSDSDEGLLARLDRLSKPKVKRPVGRPPKAKPAAAPSSDSQTTAAPQPLGGAFAPTAPRSSSPVSRAGTLLDAVPRPRARPAARSTSDSAILPPPRSSTPPARDTPGLLASLDALMNDVPPPALRRQPEEATVSAQPRARAAAPSSRPFARTKSASSAAPSLPEIIDLT